MRRSFLAMFFMAITLGSIGILVTNHLFNLLKNFKFTINDEIGTIASGILAVIMSYFAIKQSQFVTIKEYILNSDTTEIVYFRK